MALWEGGSTALIYRDESFANRAGSTDKAPFDQSFHKWLLFRFSKFQTFCLVFLEKALENRQ
jgi:hypothetical protein